MRRVLRILAWIVVIPIVIIALGWFASHAGKPDAFYAAPSAIPGKPGILVRQESFDRTVPTHAQAWRILYSTTRADGAPTLASAIVMRSLNSTTPSDGGSSARPQPVVAWAHGSTGVVPGCGRSLLPEPFGFVPALPQLLARNWIYIATDYAGQGAEGPNPALIGEGEARPVLDAVRAARQLDGIHLDDRTVVWGHSQGGHAALWTGIVAPSYSPDLHILGVAAIAPPTDLLALTERIQHTTIGRVFGALVLKAYIENYADVKAEAYTSGWKKIVAGAIAKRCLTGTDWRDMYSLLEASTIRDTIYDTSPLSGALGARLTENSPTKPISQPVLIAQGSADSLVSPDIQAEFVKRRCAAGQVIDFHRFEGIEHDQIVEPTSGLDELLIEWTQD